MKLSMLQQGTPEWHELKRGKIGGTRFGQVISGKKNNLIYELLNERLSPWIDFDDQYIDEDMQFGIDNEPVAADLYEKQTGIKFKQVGCILSDTSPIHLASPDRLSEDNSIVLEIKCTQNGRIHLQRFWEGVETSHMAQIKNYFAVSEEVKEVHWISYCPDRFERPIIPYIFRREMFEQDIPGWLFEVKQIELRLDKMQQQFMF